MVLSSYCFFFVRPLFFLFKNPPVFSLAFPLCNSIFFIGAEHDVQLDETKNLYSQNFSLLSFFPDNKKVVKKESTVLLSFSIFLSALLGHII